MNRYGPTTVAALAIASASASSLSQTITDAGFLPGGLKTNVAAISANGSTIVGSADFQGNTHAFKWTAAHGIIDLGVIPGQINSAATAVSSDGSIVIGQSGFTITRWTPSGLEVAVPFESGDQFAFVAAGTTANAATIVGNMTCAGVSGGDSSCPTYGYAFLADQSGTRTPLEQTLPAPFYGPESFRAYAISPDGSVVVGSCAATSEDTDGTRAFRWTPDGSMQNLGIVPGFQPAGTAQSHSTALAISRRRLNDRRQLPGPAPRRGRLHHPRLPLDRAAAGIQDLGTIPGTFNTITANAVNSDGSMIVGGIANFTLFNQRALLWTPTQGWVDLNTYLPTVGVNLAGWTLTTAVAISSDGRTITGIGTRAGNLFHTWIVTLPPAPPHCGSADFNGDGDTGTDQDIEAFFACLSGACCPTCGSADFNGDGDLGTDQDIESFFRVLGGGSC